MDANNADAWLLARLIELGVPGCPLCSCLPPRMVGLLLLVVEGRPGRCCRSSSCPPASMVVVEVVAHTPCGFSGCSLSSLSQERHLDKGCGLVGQVVVVLVWARWIPSWVSGCRLPSPSSGIGLMVLKPPLESWVFVPLPPVCAFALRYVHAIDVLREPLPPLLCFASGLRCGQAPHPALQAHPLQHVVGWGVCTWYVGVKTRMGRTPPWGQVEAQLANNTRNTEQLVPHGCSCGSPTQKPALPA